MDEAEDLPATRPEEKELEEEDSEPEGAVPDESMPAEQQTGEADAGNPEHSNDNEGRMPAVSGKLLQSGQGPGRAWCATRTLTPSECCVYGTRHVATSSSYKKFVAP